MVLQVQGDRADEQEEKKTWHMERMRRDLCEFQEALTTERRICLVSLYFKNPFNYSSLYLVFSGLMLLTRRVRKQASIAARFVFTISLLQD